MRFNKLGLGIIFLGLISCKLETIKEASSTTSNSDNALAASILDLVKANLLEENAALRLSGEDVLTEEQINEILPDLETITSTSTIEIVKEVITATTQNTENLDLSSEQTAIVQAEAAGATMDIMNDQPSLLPLENSEEQSGAEQIVEVVTETFTTNLSTETSAAEQNQTAVEELSDQVSEVVIEKSDLDVAVQQSVLGHALESIMSNSGKAFEHSAVPDVAQKMMTKVLARMGTVDEDKLPDFIAKLGEKVMSGASKLQKSDDDSLVEIGASITAGGMSGLDKLGFKKLGEEAQENIMQGLLKGPISSVGHFKDTAKIEELMGSLSASATANLGSLTSSADDVSRFVGYVTAAPFKNSEELSKVLPAAKFQGVIEAGFNACSSNIGQLSFVKPEDLENIGQKMMGSLSHVDEIKGYSFSDEEKVKFASGAVEQTTAGFSNISTLDKTTAETLFAKLPGHAFTGISEKIDPKTLADAQTEIQEGAGKGMEYVSIPGFSQAQFESQMKTHMAAETDKLPSTVDVDRNALKTQISTHELQTVTLGSKSDPNTQRRYEAKPIEPMASMKPATENSSTTTTIISPEPTTDSVGGSSDSLTP